MDVIVNLLFFDLPLKPASVQGEYCWTMPPHGRLTQQVLLTHSCLAFCSPPQTCKRFKEKIVEQPRWIGNWLNKCHWHILLNDSLLLFYSPPQTCKRFKEKIVRQCRSMRQFDCNLCPLDAGERSFISLSFSCADLRLRKTLSTISECHPLRQCTWEEHRWLLLNVAIYANNSKLNCFDSFCWPNECQSRNSNRQVAGSLLLSDCAWVALSSAMVTECRAKRKHFSNFTDFVLCNKCQSRSLSRQFVVPISLPDCTKRKHQQFTERRTICTPFRSSIVLIDFDWSNERQSCNSNRQFVVISCCAWLHPRRNVSDSYCERHVKRKQFSVLVDLDQSNERQSHDSSRQFVVVLLPDGAL